MSTEVKEIDAVMYSFGDVLSVRYTAPNGHQFLFRARIDQRGQVLREIGKEAADLESRFTWNDAAGLSPFVRRHWPDVDPWQAIEDYSGDCNEGWQKPKQVVYGLKETLPTLWFCATVIGWFIRDLVLLFRGRKE